VSEINPWHQKNNSPRSAGHGFDTWQGQVKDCKIDT